MSDLDTLVRATVKLESGTRLGSGFLVAADLIATCGHVVGDRGDAVRVRCHDGTELEGHVLETDPDHDVALVAVPGSIGVSPLLLSDATEELRGSPWFSYGYPIVANGAAVLIEGVVRLVASEDSRRRAALQLYSDDTAAGTGALLRGFSGSAVLSRGRVIGQLRTTPEERGQGTQLGLTFACPSAAIAALAVRAERTLGTPPRKRDPQPALAPYDPTWYVPRPREERRALDDLDARKPVVLVGPERFGKSSLLYRILELATNRERQRGRSPRIAEVDFGELGIDSSVGLPAFFVPFFEAILNTLELDVGVMLSGYNGSISGPSAGQLMGKILERSDSPLYLVLHRAELLIRWPHMDSFAQIVRAWASLQRPAFKRLRILAKFSTASALLVEAMPSFNIAPQPIEVDDLDHGQALEMARLYELEWGSQEIDRLCGVVGGHPYLLQEAMYIAVKESLTVEEILDNVGGAGGVFREFVDRNIDRIRTTDSLRQATCDLMCGRRPAQTYLRRLYEAGIIRRGPNVNDLPRPKYPLLDPHLRAMCDA